MLPLIVKKAAPPTVVTSVRLTERWSPPEDEKLFPVTANRPRPSIRIGPADSIAKKYSAETVATLLPSMTRRGWA